MFYIYIYYIYIVACHAVAYHLPMGISEVFIDSLHIHSAIFPLEMKPCLLINNETDVK